MSLPTFLIPFLLLWSAAATAAALRPRRAPSCAACFQRNELQQRHDAALARLETLQRAFDAAVAQNNELRRRPLISQVWLNAPTGFYFFEN